MVVLIENAQQIDRNTLRQKDVTLYIDERLYGKGLLDINERNITWINEHNQGIKVNYLSLSAHGICRDKSRVPEDCIFLFYDKKINGLAPINNIDGPDSTTATTSDSPYDIDEDEEESTNLYLIPGDKGTLDALYLSIKECQKLNPDIDEPESSENEDDEYWEPNDSLDGHIIEHDSVVVGPAGDFDTPTFDANGQLLYNPSNSSIERTAHATTLNPVNHVPDGGDDDDDWVPPSERGNSQRQGVNNRRNNGDEPMNID